MGIINRKKSKQAMVNLCIVRYLTKCSHFYSVTGILSTCTRTVSENYNVLDENLKHLQLKAYFCLSDAEENQVPKLGRCGQLTFSFCEI